MLPGNSAPCCMCLIFRALFVLLVLILCRRGSQAFEDEITEPTAAIASSRISFLYTSFHVPGCPPRAPAASGRLRNRFSCLISHLWGKSSVLLKRQVVGQRLSVCFTRRHCQLLAAYSFIFCRYLWNRQPFPKLVWSRDLPLNPIPSVGVATSPLSSTDCNRAYYNTKNKKKLDRWNCWIKKFTGLRADTDINHISHSFI